MNGIFERRNERVDVGDGIFVDILEGYPVFMMYATCDAQLFEVVEEYADGLVVATVFPNSERFEYICIAFNRLSLLLYVSGEYNADVAAFLTKVNTACDFVSVEADALQKIENRFRINFCAELHDPIMPAFNQSIFSHQVNQMMQCIMRLFSRVPEPPEISLDPSNVSPFDLFVYLLRVSVGFIVRSKFYGFESDVKYLDSLKEQNDIEFHLEDFVELSPRRSGSSGNVSPYYHLRHHQIFAIKMSQRYDWFQTKMEYDIMTKCRHPCVNHAYGMIHSCSRYVGIVSEYAIYGSLLLMKDHPYVTGEYRYLGNLSIVVDICFGLDHVHGCGYAYRDLKYDNILICHSGRAVLCDLGSACPIERASEDIAGNVTPFYQADETKRYGILTPFSDCHFLLELFRRYGSASDVCYTAGMLNGREHIEASRPNAMYIVYGIMGHFIQIPFFNIPIMKRIIELFRIRRDPRGRPDSKFYKACFERLFQYDDDSIWKDGRWKEYVITLQPFLVECAPIQCSEKQYVEALLDRVDGNICSSELAFQVTMKMTALTHLKMDDVSQNAALTCLRLCCRMLRNGDEETRRWAMDVMERLIDFGFDEAYLYLAQEASFDGNVVEALQCVKMFFHGGFDMEKLMRSRIPYANIPIEKYAFWCGFRNEYWCHLTGFDSLVREAHLDGNAERLAQLLDLGEDMFCTQFLSFQKHLMSGNFLKERYIFKWIRYIVSFIVGGRLIGTETTCVIAEHLRKLVIEMLEVGESWDALKSNYFSTDDCMWFRWLKHDATIMGIL